MARGDDCCEDMKKALERCLKNMPREEDVKRQAEFLKAISDPARVKIIYALANGDLCVCELMDLVGMQQTVVSHHLKILKFARIISDKKSGKWVNYSLVDRRALDALKAVGESA